MSRTNIDLDEEACRSVMERYHLLTKRDAVHFALRTVAAEPLDLDRVCRRGGETVRKLVACLMVSISIRADLSILHTDADFEILTRHTDLRSGALVSGTRSSLSTIGKKPVPSHSAGDRARRNGRLGLIDCSMAKRVRIVRRTFSPLAHGTVPRSMH